MHPLLTISHLTFHEARRRKILLAALLLGLAFLAVYALGFTFVYRNLSKDDLPAGQKRLFLNFVVMAGLYAVNFLSIMASILVPIDTLSGEIESGVIQSIATKPIRRSSILMGKWVGYLFILMLYLSLMAGGVLAISWIVSGFLPPGIHIGLPLMLLEAVVFMSLSLAGGTRLSTLANGVLGFGLFGLAFLGGWMEQIGTRLGSGMTRNVGIISSLVMPSESLWQLAAYSMQPPLMRDIGLTPFSPVSVPSMMLVLWASIYIVGMLLWANWQLRIRDL
jgi:ABC-type transport system involved in multi-copper enzyme maturation permease subunit